MTQAAQFASPASMARWPDMADFIEAFCDRHDIAHTAMLRLTLLAEELFTNAVEHGHAGGAKAQIRLELDVVPDALTLLLEDTGPPFDPLTYAREHPPELDAPVGPRPVGGLGIHIVATLADSARYAREDGCNRVWLALALGDDDAQGGALPV